MDRNKSLDALSGIAILFVVVIHACVAIYSSGNYASGTIIGFTNHNLFLKILPIIIFNAVPLFVFIAGYKFCITRSDTMEYKSYLLKRAIRILKPYIVMTIFYALLRKNISYIPAQLVGINPNACQFWFFPMFILVTAVYPLILKWVTSDMLRLILIATVFVLIILIHAISYTPPYMYFKYLLYFEMGYLVAKYNFLLTKKQLIWLLLLDIIILMCMLLISTPRMFGIGEELYCLLAILSFYFLMQLKDFKYLQKLGVYSFPIFLFHEPFILTPLSQHFSSIKMLNGLAAVSVLSGLVIAICIALYTLLRAIKLDKLIF